jgi:hypothetical protein
LLLLAELILMPIPVPMKKMMLVGIMQPAVAIVIVRNHLMKVEVVGLALLPRRRIDVSDQPC